MLLAPAIGGCAPDMFRPSPWDEEGVLEHGWVPPRDLPAEAVYCYRTLAAVDCYDRPRPAQFERRQGTPLPNEPAKTGPS